MGFENHSTIGTCYVASRNEIMLIVRRARTQSAGRNDANSKQAASSEFPGLPDSRKSLFFSRYD
ncbi:uncharacterized protein ARMOST_20489 [Armillaria ostoyae]|uniref:Uncharacterized protein n=1 Tax=Armillaria ostoyae TaxID=47428 RepID=A0A284S7I3_ARMOS|nr:uncharacterized protein ARMOST_20489 [Armillaria ostoyae]